LESLSHRITTPVMPDDEPLDFPETCCYTVENQEPKSDLWVLPLQGDRKPAPFLRTEFNESYGQFSPTGHWIAYTSDESCSDEIYVREFSSGSAQ